MRTRKVAQFVFIKGNEVPEITYDKRKDMKQKGVISQNLIYNAETINRR